MEMIDWIRSVLLTRSRQAAAPPLSLRRSQRLRLHPAAGRSTPQLGQVAQAAFLLQMDGLHNFFGGVEVPLPINQDLSLRDHLLDNQV
mmetsp:Transcript_67033/g.145735  ORF Transcript_67033/g.145735 Transcript_67033/m.145735 type:complete len:88 (+) Transcript_67033:860-1123(+)